MNSPEFTRRHLLQGSLATLGSVVVVGCTGDDYEEPTPTPTPESRPSPTPEPTPPEFDISWDQIGPLGGPVTDVTVSEVDPNRAYATTRNAGLYYSEDGGRSWMQAKESMHHQADVWIHPTNPDVAYTRGEYSTDGGVRWDRLPPYDEGATEVTAVAFDQEEPNNIYIASDEGLFRSPNDGQTWTLSPVEIGGEEKMIERLLPHPTSTGEVLAGTRDGHLLQTDDHGDSWTVMDGSQEIPESHVRGIAFSDQSQRSVYLAINGYGIYHVDNGDVEARASELDYHQFHWWSNFERSPGETHLYFVAGSTADGEIIDRTMFCYNTDSDTVESIDTPSEPVSVSTHPTDPNRLYLGGLMQPYVSENRGSSWESRSDGFEDSYLVTTAVNPTYPETILVGTVCSGGLFVSQDGGETWDWHRSGIGPWHGDQIWSEHYLMQTAAAGEFAYATSMAGIAASHDNGETWELLDTDFSGEEVDHLHGLAVDPDAPETVYVGTGIGGVGSGTDDSFGGSFIWRSDDGGMTWVEITEGFPTDVDTVIQDIVVNPHDSDQIFVATKDEDYLPGGTGEDAGEGIGIFRSPNRGDQWEQLETPFENVHAVAVDGENQELIYASTNKGVFRSLNGGDDWDRLLENTALALDTVTDIGGGVFAAVKEDAHHWAVLVSKDEGETWHFADLRIQGGTPDTQPEGEIDFHVPYSFHGRVMWFDYDEEFSRLFVATDGAALWRATIDMNE